MRQTKNSAFVLLYMFNEYIHLNVNITTYIWFLFVFRFDLRSDVLKDRINLHVKSGIPDVKRLTLLLPTLSPIMC